MADDKTEDGKDDTSADNKNKKERTPAEQRTEYFEQLEKWLHEAYAWHSVAATLPYYLMSGQIINPTSGGLPFISQVSTTQNSFEPLAMFTNNHQNDSVTQRRPQEPVGPPFETPEAEGIEYRIPPIWKRFVAQFIDATMLFFMKIAITVIAIDKFGIINIDELTLTDIDLLIGYKMAVDMTFGLFVVEIIYRIVECMYEMYWHEQGLNGRNGVTPGKFFMGLKVVRCRSVTPVERPEDPDVVLVSPGTDLDLFLTLRRSVVKGLMLLFFFPICFTLFIFRFNRTTYDLVCNTIVVEDPLTNQNNNRPHQN